MNAKEENVQMSGKEIIHIKKNRAARSINIIDDLMVSMPNTNMAYIDSFILGQ